MLDNLCKGYADKLIESKLEEKKLNLIDQFKKTDFIFIDGKRVKNQYSNMKLIENQNKIISK